MATLLIEHSISDFDTWREAYGRFAERRRASGVLHERILQPIDDPHYVLVDLEFATRDAARTFLTFLQTQVWSTPANSPALVGGPQARIADDAPIDPAD
ncbi:hypothetical protein [Aeromicrobium sp.]|uniref:hypothetical protein n=1 Tax=Aeromicrobium sp. TaxID=1871063 RepID=UPI003C4A141D